MKDIHLKLTRYSTAIGALLAISATGNAAVIQGTFNSGDPELDRFLDHDDDNVFIDINNDGINDFYGEFSSNTFFSSAWIQGIGAGNYVANEESGSSEFLTRFNLHSQIGPTFDYSYSWGYIFNSSSGIPEPTSLAAPFDPSNDAGYIGVVMHTPEGDKFGWIQINIDSNSHVEFIACASESSNDTAILAGNSSTVPVLPIASAAGIGLVGLMAALKRRKKNNTI